MQPKISIITPSFNQGKFLEQTIDSVLSQNYSNLEYIVIDGASKDDSVEIIKKYEKYLSFWVSEPDRGQSDAINKGLRRATGEVINWLNSDDYYEQNTLQIVSEVFKEPQINVLCGRSRIFYDEGNKTSHFSSGTDIYLDNLSKTIAWARIDQPETFFRGTAVQKMGLLNTKFHYVMDKEWWIRYLLLFGLNNIKKNDDILVNFRLHQQSKTISQKSGFLSETNSIFGNLAEIYDLNSEYSTIESIEPVKQLLEKSFYEHFDKTFIQIVLHYYLLYQADAFYYQNQRDRAKICINELNKNLLDTESGKVINKLKSRMKVPVWLTKIIRNS